MRNNVVRIVVGVLLLCMVTAIARSDPPNNQDIQTTIKALKTRIKDQERRLAELESQQSGRHLERPAARQSAKYSRR